MQEEKLFFLLLKPVKGKKSQFRAKCLNSYCRRLYFPSLCHRGAQLLVKSVCEKAPKSLFWALTYVPGFEYAPWLAIVDLPIRLKRNSKRISCNSLTTLLRRRYYPVRFRLRCRLLIFKLHFQKRWIFDKDDDLPGIHRNIFLCTAWMHYRHSYHTHRFQNHYIIPKTEHHQITYISWTEHITKRFIDCVGSARGVFTIFGGFLVLRTPMT